MAGEDHAEGSYGEGEIMVEIVGSDVFVNCVSSHNRDLDGLERENTEENTTLNASETMHVGNEEVLNPEISEEKVVKCEAVDIVKSELSDCHVETVVDGIVQTSEMEEILADLAQLDEDTFTYHGATNAVDQDNVPFDGNNCAVGEVGLVFSTESPKNEVFASESKEDIVKLDSASSNEETIKPRNLFRMYQPNEGHFRPSDLVWGKVQNFPWWPGQIFHDTDASEKAIKQQRKDSHLVAYFGEQMFAWNDPLVLKPFMPYFSQTEKQGNSEAYQRAISSALEEVSRRIEFGLTCSCIPKYIYVKIGTQVVKNPGIHEKSRRNSSLNYSSRPALFEPDKLLYYITNLGSHASLSADRLDLVIAKAQLFAFYRFKGYHSPIKFLSCAEFTNNGRVKQRCTPVDDSHSTELMTDKVEDDKGCKRKAEELFKFDGANDSYRKNKIIQNYSAEQLRHDWQNRAANHQPVQFMTANFVKTAHALLSKQKLEADNVKRQKQGTSSPAELILNFGKRNYIPTELNLNKTFRRFGPLIESETVADRDSGCAKVIFKRGSDAEVAVDSAKKFNIFGQVVKYEIGYSPVISVKVSPLAMPPSVEGERL